MREKQGGGCAMNKRRNGYICALWEPPGVQATELSVPSGGDSNPEGE